MRESEKERRRMAGAGMSVGGALGMLRTRRRDVSVKPNRKLDRKSSRGMIYENEELRLRTIHINAEVEQGKERSDRRGTRIYQRIEGGEESRATRHMSNASLRCRGYSFPVRFHLLTLWLNAAMS